MKSSKHLILLFFFLILFNCVSPKGVFKPGYNFSSIKKILVLPFSAPSQYSNVGDIVSDIFAQKFLEKNYQILGREVVKNETDFSKIIDIAKSNNIDVIISGSIFKYSVEKKIHALSKKGKNITVSNKTNLNLTITETEKEFIVTEGRVYGFDVGIPYEIEANIGIIAKMIDVKSSEIIWSHKSESSAFNIEDAIESAIITLIKSMPEPLGD